MDIKTSIKDSANASASVKFSAKELEDKKLELARQAAKKTSIAGFRKGKVPASVLLQRYGKDIDQDAKNHLWDEIRMKKLYRRKIVVRDCNGKFDQTIQ